jgi:SAM-dependent methyltransferase
VDFVVGDVLALDYPDGSFDVVHAHQVLQHVGDPVAALREMRRVCRPGGVVAARDSDYASFAWYPRSHALDQWLALYRGLARRNGGEPDAARHLLSWAQRAGFDDVTPTASTWCFATQTDRAWWGVMWSERIIASDIGNQAVQSGLASMDDLARMSRAWREWSEAGDGWFAIMHGEIVCRRQSD